MYKSHATHVSESRHDCPDCSSTKVGHGPTQDITKSYHTCKRDMSRIYVSHNSPDCSSTKVGHGSREHMNGSCHTYEGFTHINESRQPDCSNAIVGHGPTERGGPDCPVPVHRINSNRIR